MRGNTAFPFITIPDELVEFSPWMAGTKDEPLHPAASILENWDYARDLEVRCGVTLSPEKIANQLQIPLDQLSLEIVMRAGTGKGRFPRRVWVLDRMVMSSGTEAIQMRGLLNSSKLSARLHLECSIFLASVPTGGQLVSPVKPGSRLWSSAYDILLEDDGDSRFPMESMSFRSTFSGQPYESAPWYFCWLPGDYEMDFAGATRLYVNMDKVAMHQRIVDGDSIILQPVVYDVISQILSGAVNDENFWNGIHSYPEGSVGGQARNWLELAFPDKPMASIKTLLQMDPGAFNAAILSVAEMGGDE